MAAIAVRGGISVNRPTGGGKQADFIFTTPCRKIAVECKRLRSAARLRDAVTKARDQIKGSGYPGWIIMDLSLVTDAGEYIKQVPGNVTDAALATAHVAAMKNFGDAHIEMLVDRTAATNIARFTWYDCILRPATEVEGNTKPALRLGVWSDLPLKPAEHPARKAVDDVKMIFDGALPNQ